MSATTIDTVRGMRDILSLEQQHIASIQRQLELLLQHYGYHALDLPILEYRDLYLRKMGEELVGKVYEFSFGGRNLALRPEWTASVLRAYVAHMQDQPLPLRVCYAGPVFRYQRPQRLTYRQFMQMGGEIIGGTAPRADAEVIALACEGLERVGVPSSSYRVHVGHIGILRELLQQLGLTERTRGFLIWSMERLRSHGIEAVRTHISNLLGDMPIAPSLFQELDNKHVASLMQHMLQEIGVNLSFGTRPPAEIVERLVRKVQQDDTPERIDYALSLLWQLSQVQGEPHETMNHVAAIVADAGLHTPALDELRAIVQLLEAHGLTSNVLTLDFGMGRGLHYYTGAIFEITDEHHVQLCGGGRYDDLVTTLGGNQPVAAVGFAYGIDRVAAAVPTSHTATHTCTVLVVPVHDDDYPYALHVAQHLRTCGFIVTMDVRGRTVSSNLRYAAKQGIPYVAIIGADERAARDMVWRDVTRRNEQHISLDALDTLAHLVTHT